MEVADALSGHRPRTVLNLPPGYHFAPTDEELVVHYLRRQFAGLPPLLPIFKDVASLVNHRPEQITDKFNDCGDDRWFFFTKRSRKYARGNRPNRMTPGNGFWKATGPQRMIYSGKREKRLLVGRVRTLVFYTAPSETDDKDEKDDKAALSEWKTSWTMYEYENLTSEAEAADKNVDKLDEWVLCTIQKQKEKEKKDDGNETSPAVDKKVKETKGKEKIKVVASKKKKGKQEKIEPEDGTDQDPIHALRPKKRSKVPMRPSHPEMAAPEEGDEMGMFGFEYNSCPKEGSPVPTKHESPHSETMSPCVIDNNYYGPNMAPTPCLQEPPYSESEMMSACARGDYNIGSAVSSNMISWQGSPFPEIMVPGNPLGGNTNSFSPHMGMEYETSSFLGYSYHNIAPNLVTHQPATSYMYPHSAAAQLGAYSYGGATQNAAGRHNSYGYTDGEFMAMLSSQTLGGCFADSLQYNYGPSVLGPGRAARPAAALPRQDQVSART